MKDRGRLLLVTVLFLGVFFSSASLLLWLYVPRLSIDASDLALGEVPLGTRIRKELTLRNVGRKPLHLLKIATSCTCTTSELQTDVIQPSESGKLIIAIRTPTQEHSATERVFVQTNELGKPTHEFPITFTATATVRAEPEWVNFGTLLPGTLPATSAVKLLPLKLWFANQINEIRLESMSPHLDVHMTEKAGAYSLELLLLNSLPLGTLSTEVRLFFPYPHPHAVAIPVHAVLKGDYGCRPDSLFLRASKPQALPLVRCELTGTGPKTEILAVKPSGEAAEWLDINVEEGAGKSKLLVVTMRNEHPRGLIQECILLELREGPTAPLQFLQIPVIAAADFSTESTAAAPHEEDGVIEIN